MTQPPAPVALPDLGIRVSVLLGSPVDQVASVDALRSSTAPAVLVLTAAHADLVPALEPVISRRTEPTVLVIGDGYLGTDGPDVASALVGASVVALARSIAVRRSAHGRVNVVAVPEALLGEAGSQRGPLAAGVDLAAVAEVVAYLLGPESSYLHGQVLFADGGRHLFSSLTA
jgi:hypothetical protein